MDSCAQRLQSLFAGRKLLIATKHQKEKVIAPPLETALEIDCFVPENFDTDALGTFTGEVERGADPLSTARKKCRWAMEHSGCDLAVASEGSFGSHPFLFFARADEEWLVLIDEKNDLEIVTRELSTDTNFNGEAVGTEAELSAFAKTAGFPSHGLILRAEKDSMTGLRKNITSWESLKQNFHELIALHARAYVETDMRAMYNPTRMSVIERAAYKLVEKIRSCCPQCNMPGFAITQAQPGLPCSWCRQPTRSTLYYLYSCVKCDYTKEKRNPDKGAEDPMYCDYCNP